MSCTHLTQFDLDSIWTFIFGVPASSATVVGSIHNMCTEAAFLLLAMLRSMLNLVSLQASCFRNMHPRSNCWHWDDCPACHLVVYQRFFTTADENFWMKWETSDQLVLKVKNKRFIWYYFKINCFHCRYQEMQVILMTTDPQTTEAEISLYLTHSLGSQRRRVPGWENIPSLSCSFSVTSITTSQIWHPCGTARTSCVHLLLQFSPSIYGPTLRWYAVVLFVC